MLPGPLSWTNPSRGQSIQNTATMALQEQLVREKQLIWCGIAYPHLSVSAVTKSPSLTKYQAMR